MQLNAIWEQMTLCVMLALVCASGDGRTCKQLLHSFSLPKHWTFFILYIYDLFY